MISFSRTDFALPAADDADPPAAAEDRARDELTTTVEEVTIRACARQRATLESLMALRHALELSRDPVRTAEAWMDWETRARERLAEEARDQRAISLALARCRGDGGQIAPAEAGRPVPEHESNDD